MNLPHLSKKEYAILAMLIRNGEMYGLEMVKASEGALKRGTIYVTLGRMAEKGYVTSRQQRLDDQAGGLPRRLFRPTGYGQSLFQALELARANLALAT